MGECKNEDRNRNRDRRMWIRDRRMWIRGLKYPMY